MGRGPEAASSPSSCVGEGASAACRPPARPKTSATPEEAFHQPGARRPVRLSNGRASIVPLRVGRIKSSRYGESPILVVLDYADPQMPTPDFDLPDRERGRWKGPGGIEGPYADVIFQPMQPTPDDLQGPERARLREDRDRASPPRRRGPQGPHLRKVAGALDLPRPVRGQHALNAQSRPQHSAQFSAGLAAEADGTCRKSFGTYRSPGRSRIRERYTPLVPWTRHA